MPVHSPGAVRSIHSCGSNPAPSGSPSLPAAPPTHTSGLRHPYPDEHREQTPAARGQVDVGIQEVLVDKGVGEEGKPGQD